MEIFHVQAPGMVQDPGLTITLVSLALVAAGVVFLIRNRKISKSLHSPIGVLLVGVILLVTSFVIYASTGGSTIVIRQGSITVSGPLIGNDTYKTSDVKTAFVEDVNMGSVTLGTKDYGTNLGNFNEGVYTLSNGATAHVVSANQTDLVIELNSGLYLVLGTSNTNVLVSDFVSNVAPVTEPGT